MSDELDRATLRALRERQRLVEAYNAAARIYGAQADATEIGRRLRQETIDGLMARAEDDWRPPENTPAWVLRAAGNGGR